MSPEPLRWEANAIRLPSGDHAGSYVRGWVHRQSGTGAVLEIQQPDVPVLVVERRVRDPAPVRRDLRRVDLLVRLTEGLEQLARTIDPGELLQVLALHGVVEEGAVGPGAGVKPRGRHSEGFPFPPELLRIEAERPDPFAL